MATPIPDNFARFSLADVAAAVGAALPPELAGREVEGIVTDSRRVREGNLYVALRGETHDGHRFVPQARQRGAVAVLVAADSDEAGASDALAVGDTLGALGDIAMLHMRSWPGRVVAITGSAGKTTTKELTFAALRAVGVAAVRTQGNLNNLVGVPLTLLCLEPADEVAVIEIGTSAPGEIARLAELCRPEVGVVTSVAVAHAEGLGSLADVAREKASLLWALPPDGTAIYHADQPVLVPELARVRAQKLSFGTSRHADLGLRAHEIAEDGHSACVFELPNRNTLSTELSLFGVGPALDAAAALAVVWALFGEEHVARAATGLAAVSPVPGRLAPVPGPSGSLLLDDSYNANPASTAASLETLAELARARGGRALCALGDMRELGEHSRAEHARIGELVAKLGVSVFVGCGVEMTAALEAAREAAPRLATAHVADATQVAPIVEPLLGEGDVLLVKGSRSLGMERAVAALVEGGGDPEEKEA